MNCFFGNYDVKETVVPTVVPSVAPYETGYAYLSFTLGTAPYDPMNNNIIAGSVKYISPDTNMGTSTLFELNDGRGVCNIKCYNNNELTIYAYLDAPYIPRMDLKSIECNGDISSYKPIGTIVPKLTGNNTNINVILNF